MNRYRVCVYAICKNEEAFVDGWVDSMAEADEIVVTDTGSTDGTIERLRARGVTVYSETIKPWRFDVARNISLRHVPDEADVCVCTDLDERFEPGWRAALERVWQPGTTSGRYIYNWSLKPDGTPAIQFTYFKVHVKKNFQWICPVHEYLVWTAEVPQQIVRIPGMVLNHYPDPKKSRSSYLPLLETAVEEAPNDDRMVHYLGREYMFVKEWDKCIAMLRRHVEMPSSTWPEERCASMRWIALAYHRLGKRKEALRWYYRAIAEAPHMREPFVEAGAFAYETQNWPLTLLFMESALAITEKSTVYVNTEQAWDHTPHDLAAIAACRMGMRERALPHAKEACALAPEDLRLRRNLEILEKGFECGEC